MKLFELIKRCNKFKWCLLIVVCALIGVPSFPLLPNPTIAHKVRPGFLEIKTKDGMAYDVLQMRISQPFHF
jgi:hypothetical protein